MDITTDKTLNFSPQLIAENRTAVMGVSGTGNTNTVAVLIEELSPHMPVFIVDPEGEMWTLREKIPNLLIVGNSENVDVVIQPHQAEAVAGYAVEHGQSVILDLFDYETEDEIEATAEGFARGLFNACKQKRTPHLLVVEEAHMFFPQPMKRGSAWAQIARRGRKFGIGMVLATQRSQNVDKDILTQCQIRILHSVSHPRDVSVYKDLIPLPSRAAESAIRKLDIGESILVYPDAGMQVKHPVKIRLRHTHHAGATPQLDGSGIDVPEMKATNDESLSRLKAILEASTQAKVDPEIEKRDKQIKTLKEENAILDGLVKDLQKDIASYKPFIAKLQERIEVLKLIEIAPITVQVQMVGEQVIAQAAGAEGDPVPVATKPKSSHAIYQKSLLQFAPDESGIELIRQRQETKLGNLIKNILVFPPNQRLVLWYLATHPTAQMTMSDISKSLGYAESTMVNNHPGGLVELGILKRWKVGRVYHYQSNLEQHIQTTFPDLDWYDAAQRVIRAVQPEK